jgi:hypothetical protein
MPIHQGTEKGKPYFQYGTHGKKYFYKPHDTYSHDQAYEMALRQAQAIHASQNRRL